MGNKIKGKVQISIKSLNKPSENAINSFTKELTKQAQQYEFSKEITYEQRELKGKN